jgi:NADH-quinone oxidoreductase subunit N
MTMTDRILLSLPEIALVCGAVVVSMLGLAKGRGVRDSVPFVSVGFLLAAFFLIPVATTDERLLGAKLLMPTLPAFAKSLITLIGIPLVLLSAGRIDAGLERAAAEGRVPFAAIRATRGEFHAFMLLSLAGACLVSTAGDLAWLFLAIELVSLPTYIMIAISRPVRAAQESALKYFFLGALSTAVVLYGFSLLYGATGTVELVPMAERLAQQAAGGGLSSLATMGLAIAILGLCFKIGAVPMHFYMPDVYEGAAAPVTAFIAFVPKVAGFLALILLLSTVGWTGHVALVGGEAIPVEGLPQPITALLWMIAVLTMTLGNVGALLQKSVKRMLAYSSIANTGYMLIGVIAGPLGILGSGPETVTGLHATLFFLLGYGIMNVAAFGPIASLERQGGEVDSFEDIAGLRQRSPAMAWMLAIGAFSLIGVPPLLGFWGKLFLFAAGVSAGQMALVVVAALNSAIGAWYYLRLASEPIVGHPSARSETVTPRPSPWPRLATVACALGLVVVPFFLPALLRTARFEPARPATDGVETAAASDAPAGVDPER